MPPLPFPFPLGIGTDIIKNSRIRKLITQPGPQGSDKLHGLTRFLRRVFTHREQDFFWRKFPATTLRNEYYDQLKAVTGHIAGRWAAKEAAIKAVKPKRITHQDVEILPLPHGRGIYALIGDSSSSRNSLPERKAGEDEGIAEPIFRYQVSSKEKRHFVQETHFLAQEVYENSSGQVARISISHEDDFATAFCIATEIPEDGDVGGEAAARMP